MSAHAMSGLARIAQSSPSAIVGDLRRGSFEE